MFKNLIYIAEVTDHTSGIRTHHYALQDSNLNTIYFTHDFKFPKEREDLVTDIAVHIIALISFYKKKNIEIFANTFRYIISYCDAYEQDIHNVMRYLHNQVDSIDKNINFNIMYYDKLLKMCESYKAFL